MPFWAFLHFYDEDTTVEEIEEMCQCPSGLSFISTWIAEQWRNLSETCVNALLGFPSFLQHPSGTHRNKAFSRPFLQVFI